MNELLFSILVANYNNGKYFKDCYDSIINQTYNNWECIIVDDCSTDDSMRIINELVKNDTRFKIHKNNENSGVGYTKRKCVELASGEICGFLDPDDSIENNAIELMILTHQKNTQVGLVYSQFRYCDEELKAQKIHITDQVENQDKSFFNFNGKISHFATFKKSYYNRTEGIDSYLKRAVDQDLYLKLHEEANVLFLDETLYNYRFHKGGVSTFENGEKAYFWHWVVIMNAARRRNINIEDVFVDTFIQKVKCEKMQLLNEVFRNRLKNSKWLKIGHRLGLFNAYKYL